MQTMAVVASVGALVLASACGLSQNGSDSGVSAEGGTRGDGSPGSTSSSGAGSGSGSGGSSGSSGSGSGSSSSGSGSGSSGGSSGGGSGGVVVDSGAACQAPISGGAVALAANYLAGSVIGSGGYAYAYDDGNGSTICVDATALCAAGSTAVASGSTVWGAGLGVNLAQAQGSAADPTPSPGAFAATGAGIAYSLSSLPPQGARLGIDHSGADYCATLSAASGTVAWDSFNTACWDGSGTSLTAAPADATHVEVQIVADAATTPFAFCVDALSFAATVTTPDSGPTGGDGSVCTWTAGPSSNDGLLTCYDFGQGTSQGGGCPSYKTYCGYCGTEASGPSGGACQMGHSDSVANVGTGQYFAAFAQSSAFGNGAYCGMCVDVSYQGHTITATIVDECATCGGDTAHIDLSLDAAQALGIGVGNAIGDPSSGVTWQAVSCPVTGDIYAQFNGSSSQIYFQNMTFPVASATAGGHTAHQDNAQSGYWDFGANVAGETVTLTDTLGHTTSGVIPGSSGTVQGAQFTDSCN